MAGYPSGQRERTVNPLLRLRWFESNTCHVVHTVIRTAAVDFDGVIHWYRRGWQDGSIYDDPVPGSLSALRKLMERYAVFINTSRDASQVGEWLAKKGFSVCLDDGIEFWNTQGTLLVTKRKLAAAVYIDDRGLYFISWNETFEELERREKVWDDLHG